LRHELVDVLELLRRRPAGVAAPPAGARREPDGERLREVLVGMGLRVRGLEVDDVAPAVGLRRVVLRIALRRAPEARAPVAPAPQAEGVVDGMSRLVT